jgi:hypothetical protein
VTWLGIERHPHGRDNWEGGCGELGNGKQKSRYHNDHKARKPANYRLVDQSIDSGLSAVAELPGDEAEEQPYQTSLTLTLSVQMTTSCGAKLPAHRSTYRLCRGCLMECRSCLGPGHTGMPRDSVIAEFFKSIEAGGTLRTRPALS